MYEVNDTLFISVPEEDETDNPWLTGAFRPQRKEYSVSGDHLEIIGEIPADLNGVYIRNTHNQAQQPLGIYHPFDGDGMLHAIRFDDGKVEYRNKFVRTTGFLAEQGAKESLWPGMLDPGNYQRRGWGSMGSMKDNAGTDVIGHAGNVIASMSQGSEPWCLSPKTLETYGVNKNWAAMLPDGLASHYKVDTETGDMIFFNYPEKAPYMNYGVINKEDQMVHYVPIELPGARWPHDIGMTKPCWIMHLSNCYEDGDWVVQDGCIWDNPVKPPIGDPNDVYGKIHRQLDKRTTNTHMYRSMFNMRTGEVKEFSLDDEVTEFPIVSNDFVGVKNRYSYNSIFGTHDWVMTGVMKYDLLLGTSTRWDYGEGRFGSEVCIPMKDNFKVESDAYVVTFVIDLIKDRAECIILDASDIEAGPICTIVLPERISGGTHATWIEADRMDGENRQLPEGKYWEI